MKKLIVGAMFVVASSLALGCGDRSSTTPTPEECRPSSPVDPSAPITRVGVHFMAGNQPLVMGKELTAANGATFKPSKARFYLSEVALIAENGERVAAELVDEGGEPLPYGLTLLDLDRPESLALNLRAPAGNYRGMAVSVGVPETCDSGIGLNHSDASAMEVPLDVDSDMYWSWNPGYVFLKFEGKVLDHGSWKNFFFHVGDDKRFSRLQLETPFHIDAGGGSGPEIIADFNRLLVSPSGEAKPNISDPDEREVHTGAHSDSLAENIRGSGFLRLAQGHD